MSIVRVSYTKYAFKLFLLVLVLATAFSLLYLMRNFRQDIKAKHFRKFTNGPQTELLTQPALTPFAGKKIVHLDLKGAPPKVSYLKELFPLLSAMGATGLLIEYEDMFPYSGSRLGNVSAYNAYTLDEVGLINGYARDSHLQVIPLVQTFGHLEFMLKLQEFEELREVVNYPSSICPSHPDVLPLIGDMIGQIMDAHPESTMLHMGADEVFFLGECDRCRTRMQTKNFSRSQLFMDHINAVSSLIGAKYPDLRILMWDDEFRSITFREISNMHLNPKIEPVVWRYTKEISDDLGPSLWEMYEKLFPKVWIASAFKGATGSRNYVVDSNHYIENHRSWLDLYTSLKMEVNFQGIIITGWQRYDHFAVLCDLLPAAIPSLAMCLRALNGYQDSPLSPPRQVSQLLQCDQTYALMGSAFGTPHCSYPGGNVLENVLRLQILDQDIRAITKDSRYRGWMTDYNYAHAFSNPQYVKTVTESLNRIKIDLESLRMDMAVAMQEVYDNYTIAEWVDTYLKPLEELVEKMWNGRELLLSKDSWKRRPLNYKPKPDL